MPITAGTWSLGRWKQEQSRSKAVSFFLLPRDGHGFTVSFGALASLPREPGEVPQSAEQG